MMKFVFVFLMFSVGVSVLRLAAKFGAHGFHAIAIHNDTRLMGESE